jgi:hypothetical protein
MKPIFNKKAQLAEQIMNVLEGKVSGDMKYTYAQIELMVEQQLAYQMKASLFSNYKVGEPINPGQFITSFEDVPVKRNDSRKRDYIDLPARFIDLPGVKGVWAIRAMGNDYNTFIPLRLGSSNFTTVDETPFLQGNIGYEVEGLKAYFIPQIKDNITSCLVQLVTPNSVDLNIPADFDSLVIDAVISRLVNEKDSDKIADNAE